MSFCQVNGCRFSSTHVTSVHLCGTCHQQGHGQVECGNVKLIAKLDEIYVHIPIDIQCCAKNCPIPTTHIIDGHKCNNCSMFGHAIIECPHIAWDLKVERGTVFGQIKELFLEKKHYQFVARKQLAWSEHQTYTKVAGEMGCMWFARRANTFEKIELFFMHGDNWGQYGISTDDRPKLNAFLHGYRCIDKE